MSKTTCKLVVSGDVTRDIYDRNIRYNTATYHCFYDATEITFDTEEQKKIAEDIYY